jgi:hydroxypyruvate isomerase
MNRRLFLSRVAAAAGLVGLAGPGTLRAVQPETRGRFKLRYAPHFGMFAAHAGEDLVDQLKFIADQGFTAFQDANLRSRSPEVQARIGREMARLNLSMGTFVATLDLHNPTFVLNDEAIRSKFLADLRDAVEVATRVEARWVTIVPGLADQRLPWDYQTANAIDNFKRCAEIAEAAGLTLVMEPLNRLTNHPGIFLSEIPQAHLICSSVGSGSCKILVDLYHQQISEGNLPANIDAAWPEIAYFHAGDNPGRKEPGTGEINFRNVFRHLHARKYEGIIGMEHGNARAGKDGELSVIQAYVDADTF